MLSGVTEETVLSGMDSGVVDTLGARAHPNMNAGIISRTVDPDFISINSFSGM